MALYNPQSMLPFVFFVIFCSFCYMFFFLRCTRHSIHSHTEHIHFLASNNISNNKNISDIQTDTFRLELYVLFFSCVPFHAFFFCLLLFVSFHALRCMFTKITQSKVSLEKKNYPWAIATNFV